MPGREVEGWQEVGFAQTPACCGINPGPGWQRDRHGSQELSCLQPQALPCGILERGHLQPLAAGQADDPLTPIQVLAAVAEDADELGHAGNEALKVHTQTAVPVAASEGLGQLVVEVEA